MGCQASSSTATMCWQFARPRGKPSGGRGQAVDQRSSSARRTQFGHTPKGMGDFSYRTREEVESWKAKCPIATFRRLAIEQGALKAADFDAIEATIQKEVEEAHRIAEGSPWPDPATASTHIYAEPRKPAPPPVPPASDRQITYSQATLEALTGEMAANPRIFVLGEGIGARGGNFKTTAGLYARSRFGPERLQRYTHQRTRIRWVSVRHSDDWFWLIIDFMFADFVLDAVGEIVNQIAKMQYMSSGRLKMPILLRGCIGIGHSAATHHSGNYYPMYAHFPGLRVVVPSTPYDAKGLLIHALRCDDPVLFLEHRELLSLKERFPKPKR